MGYYELIMNDDYQLPLNLTLRPNATILLVSEYKENDYKRKFVENKIAKFKVK